MIRYIIFDMDGLMFDTEHLNYEGYLHVFSQAGFSPSMEQYRDVIGCNYEDVLAIYRRHFGEELDAARYYRAVSEHSARLRRERGIPVKKGLYRLLDYLDEKGYHKAVASGSRPPVIRSYLEEAGIAGRMDCVVSASEVARGKPAPDVFLKACRDGGFAPEESLVLEDSVNGLKAALAGGMYAVAVPDMLPIPPELAAQVTAVADSLEEIPELLERLQGE